MIGSAKTDINQSAYDIFPRHWVAPQCRRSSYFPCGPPTGWERDGDLNPGTAESFWEARLKRRRATQRIQDEIERDLYCQGTPDVHASGLIYCLHEPTNRFKLLSKNELVFLMFVFKMNPNDLAPQHLSVHLSFLLLSIPWFSFGKTILLIFSDTHFGWD